MPLDFTLIFFAVLAAFLCYRLFTVLGTRGGHEPDDAERVRPMTRTAGDAGVEGEEPVAPAAPSRPLAEWERTVQSVYDDFDSETFINGARSAYEMIVDAFAQGNLDDVRAYVASDVLDAFQQAVDNRKASGHTMEVTFVGIERADVDEAIVEDGEISVTVAFQSDQIRVMRDANGEVVDGDPNRIDLVKDHWTFTRPVNARDPNWTLTATDGAAPAVA